MPFKMKVREVREGDSSATRDAVSINYDVTLHHFQQDRETTINRIKLTKRIMLALKQYSKMEGISLLDPLILECKPLTHGAVQIIFEHKDTIKILETLLPEIEEQDTFQIVFEDGAQVYVSNGFQAAERHDISKAIPEVRECITISTIAIIPEMNSTVIESAHQRKLAGKYLTGENIEKKKHNKLLLLQPPRLKDQHNYDRENAVSTFLNNIITPFTSHRKELDLLMGFKTQSLETDLEKIRKKFMKHSENVIEDSIKVKWNTLIAKCEPYKQDLVAYQKDLTEKVNIPLKQISTKADALFVKLSNSSTNNLARALECIAFEYFKHLLENNKLSQYLINRFNEKFSPAIARIILKDQGQHCLKLNDLSGLSFDDLSQLTNDLIKSCYSRNDEATGIRIKSYEPSLLIISDNLNQFVVENVPLYSAKLLYDNCYYKKELDFSAAHKNSIDANSEDFKAESAVMVSKVRSLAATLVEKNAQEVQFRNRLNELETEAAGLIAEEQDIATKVELAKQEELAKLTSVQKLLSEHTQEKDGLVNNIILMNKQWKKNNVSVPIAAVSAVHNKFLEMSTKLEAKIVLIKEKVEAITLLKHVSEAVKDRKLINNEMKEIKNKLDTLVVSVNDFRVAGEAAIAENLRSAEEAERARAELKAAADARAAAEAEALRVAEEAKARAADEQKRIEELKDESEKQAQVVEGAQLLIDAICNTQFWKEHVLYRGGVRVSENTKLPAGIAQMYKTYQANSVNLDYKKAVNFINSFKQVAEDAEARGEKRFCFFTVRSAQTTQLYNLISTLDVNNLSALTIENSLKVIAAELVVKRPASPTESNSIN